MKLKKKINNGVIIDAWELDQLKKDLDFYKEAYKSIEKIHEGYKKAITDISSSLNFRKY